jgi:LPPG:FO 2-phospho-L-lactate transferase
MPENSMKVTVLSGGIGGAKLVEGLASVLPATSLKVIGNIGDDDEFHGLWVSPDIDILTYTLANRVNRETGWGFEGDTLETLKILKELGEDTWMTLGDKDFAVHIFRTAARKAGKRPTEIALHMARKFGVNVPLYLPSDDLVPTRLLTSGGWLRMEEYFVRERCAPEVTEVRYENCEKARPTPEALAAIGEADILIIGPSNPVLSIAPILAIPGIREAIIKSRAYKVAVAPLINNAAIKGPTCKIMASLGLSPTLKGVAEYYHGLIDGFVIDASDTKEQASLSSENIDIYTQNILMSTLADRSKVAEQLLQNLANAVNPGQTRRQKA